MVALGKSPLQSLRYGLLGFVSVAEPVQSDDHMAKSPAFPAVQSFSPAIGNEWYGDQTCGRRSDGLLSSWFCEEMAYQLLNF